MTIYVPNSGEKEMLRNVLQTMPIELGLYKNVVSADGNLSMVTIEEMPSGGGRGYARKSLNNDIVESALASGKWYLSMNSAGKAEAQHHNDTLDFEFNSYDVADANTVYGLFGFVWVVPFDAGASEIRVGDVVKGVTSAAEGVVTGVTLISGSWAAGNAAGYLYLKSKSGTFQDNENLTVDGVIATLASSPTAGGTGYSDHDVLTITGGSGAGAKAMVASATGGVINTVVLAHGGKDYVVGASAGVSGGAGSGASLEITALAATTYAVSNTGKLFSGDAHKKLLFMEAFSEGKLIDTNGQKVLITLKLTSSTG